MTRRSEVLASRRQSEQPQTTRNASSSAAVMPRANSALPNAQSVRAAAGSPEAENEESDDGDEQLDDAYEVESEEEEDSDSEFEDITPAARKARAKAEAKARTKADVKAQVAAQLARRRRRSAKYPPTDGSCPFLSLPQETLAHIFCYLPPKHTVLFKRLCKRTAAIALDPHSSR